MVNNTKSSGIILLGLPENIRSKLVMYLAETIRFQLINCDTVDLVDLLPASTNRYVFNNPPNNFTQLRAILNWSKNNNYHLTIISLNPAQKNDENLIQAFFKVGADIIKINNGQDLEKISQEMFVKLSRYIFLEEGMAEGYYRLREICKPEWAEHIFVSGMPTFVYGGRVLMKDFDILVPENKQKIITQTIGTPVKIKDSSVAYTRSSYVGNSVETVSGLVVYAGKQKIPFSFEFLWEEVRFVRFMGLKVPIMGLEDLVLFKIALGRLGIDDFGKYKDDLSDVEGLIGIQQVNWKKLQTRAERLGMEKRLKAKLKLFGIKL